MYDKDRLEVYIQERFDSYGFELFLHTYDSIATSVTMEKKEVGYPPRGANIIIDREAATQLMEQLWNYGIRPADTKYNSDAVNAMKEHITDLRKITFKILKMDG